MIEASEDASTPTPNNQNRCVICGGWPADHPHGTRWLCSRCYAKAAGNGNGAPAKTVPVEKLLSPVALERAKYEEQIRIRISELINAGYTDDDVKKYVYTYYVGELDERAAEPGEELLLSREQIDALCIELCAERKVQPFPRDFHLTDAGNGERFLAQYGKDARYCTPLKQWYFWDGKRWKPDQSNYMMILATEVVKSLYSIAAKAEDQKERVILSSHAARSEGFRQRNEMLKSAAPYVPVDVKDLDKDPNLFNCMNGTLELDTLTFREFKRSDFNSKMSSVAFVEGAECPNWQKHLDLIFEGDQKFIEEFQIIAGYSALLGNNPEQIMIIAFGHGKNGKSVTLDILRDVVGDYGANISAEALMVNRKRGGGDATPELIPMIGARFVTSSEGDSGAELSEATIKRWTGDQEVNVRALHKDTVTISPTQKIWLATNHEPTIKGTDEGIRRRIWKIPFEKYIQEHERDPFIVQKLQAEKEGIFQWLIGGLWRYNENGRQLIQPEKIKKATEDYFSTNDLLGQFLIDEFVREPDAAEGKTSTWNVWVAWCDTNGHDAGTKPRFNKAMKDHGIKEGNKERYPSVINGVLKEVNGRRWKGIRLKSASELNEPSQ